MNIGSSMIKHFTASALIFSDEGKILLLKHKKLGVWLYPGGHVEENETTDECLYREVKEETGLDIRIVSDRDECMGNMESEVSVLHTPYAVLCEKIYSDEINFHIDMIYTCIISESSDVAGMMIEYSGQMGFFGSQDIARLDMFPNFSKLLKKAYSDRRLGNIIG